MWFRRIMATVLAVVAVGAVATPVQAAELTAGCSISGHNLSAWAYYSPAGAFNYWTEFRYLLWGEHTGGKSNAYIDVYEKHYIYDEQLNIVWFQDLRYHYASPDNLHNNVLYTKVPPGPIATQAWRSEFTRFGAVFDTAFNDDRCPAETEWI